MKKWMAMFLTLVLLLNFAACGAAEENPNPEITEKTEQTQPAAAETEKVEQKQTISVVVPEKTVITSFGEDGEITGETFYCYEYSADGHIMRVYSVIGGEERTISEFTWDEGGRLLLDNEVAKSNSAEYVYDEAGNRISDSRYMGDGELVSRYEYTRDEKGWVIGRTELIPAQNINYYTEFLRNEDGQSIRDITRDLNVEDDEETEEDESMPVIHTVEYERDENGKLRSKTMTSCGRVSRYIEYNENEQTLKDWVYYENDDLQLVVYDYDANGNNTVVSYYDKNEELTKKVEFIYNEDGEYTEMTAFTPEGVIYQHIFYEYDDNGHMTLRYEPALQNTGKYYYNQSFYRYEYTWDQDGHKLSETSYEDEETILNYTEYTYNEDGFMDGYTVYDADGNVIKTAKYNYITVEMTPEHLELMRQEPADNVDVASYYQ